MASVDDNSYDITYLTGQDTFLDWINHYNTGVVEKLNKLEIYSGWSGDGVDVTKGTTGSIQYSIADNVTKDISNNFLIIECSNDTTIDQNTNWTIPQIEWMHKKDISDNISVAETDFIDLSFNQSSTTIVSSDPIRFKNEINFDYSNGPYTQVFDAGENRQIIIEVSGNVFDLSENAHPDTFLKQNKLILEISDISGAWTVPNIEWMYKDISSSNQIPGNITDISFVNL